MINILNAIGFGMVATVMALFAQILIIPYESRKRDDVSDGIVIVCLIVGIATFLIKL